MISNTYNLKGFKCLISGRLNGSQMAKIETFKFNKSSLQHISSYVKFTSINISTKYGLLGVKV